MLKIYVPAAPSLVLIRKPNFPDTHVRHPSKWPTQIVSIPYANEATVFLGTETASDGASFVESFKALCIKFRITAKKEKPLTAQLQQGFNTSWLETCVWSEVLSYSITPNTLIGPLPKFHQTSEIFIIGPGISIKYPLRVSMRTTDFISPFHINNFVDRVIEESNIVKSGLTDVIRFTRCQMWRWIRYAEREKVSIKYQLMNHKTEFLHRDTIEKSIVPLTDWYLREPDEERKLYPPLRMSHMRSMEIQKKVKAVLENARTTQFILTPITTMPDCYRKWSLKPPTTGEECPICHLCFGYLERLGRSTVWEVVIHFHGLASSDTRHISHLSLCFCPIFTDALSSAAPTLL